MDISPGVTGFAKAVDGEKIYFSVHSNKDVCVDQVYDCVHSEERWEPVVISFPESPYDHGGILQLEMFYDCRSQMSSGTALDICVFDNRGIGQSSCPSSKESYSTETMAKDTIAVADALGWPKFHLVGFSMGGMIAMHLASIYYERLLSLSLLGVTEGGWQVFPQSWRGLKYCFKMLMAKSAEDRSRMDLKFHFSQKTLHEQVSCVGGSPQLRKDCLYEEYLEHMKQCKNQSKTGLDGQMHACFKNSMGSDDYRRIQAASIPIVVLHGRQDLVAAPKYGRTIAKKLGAKFVEIEGAHLITRECAHDVSHELMHIISDCATESERKRHLNRKLSSAQTFRLFEKNSDLWDSARNTESDTSSREISD